MAVTTIADMQIVPSKFAEYVADRTTAKNTFINAGIATPDATVRQLINGTPKGGRFIELPMWNPLEGKPTVFGEATIEFDNITTKAARATLMIWQKGWGDTDLAHVLGGADPLAAIATLMSDWRNTCEQGIYLSILKGLFDTTSGALKDHVNDISGAADAAANISSAATLDTKQLLGDHYDALGMVFMHSATYTYLQKNDMIARTPVFNPAGDTVEINTYLGYPIKVDDAMPVNEGVYDTYFIGKGAFIREEGMPIGLIGVEKDRDSATATDYLINRWCQIIHPRGMSWVNDGTYTEPTHKYPDYVDLEKPENWALTVDHKKVALACLRHKVG